MKKFLTTLLTVCLLASMLCVPVLAAGDTPAAGTVLRIRAQKPGSKSPVVIGDYESFQDGWNDAMEIAGSASKMKKKGYERILVDLYADWTANKDGEFTEEIWNGSGFDNDTIFIPANAKLTLNMNGHTINRGLTKAEGDGEVMFINDKADVIMQDGTITGGYSTSEGGGLYIESGAKVTLNNVHITGNRVKNDDGAAVYMYGGATLTMTGGSISNNAPDTKNANGTVYVKNSTVSLDGVTIDGNYTSVPYARGVVIYATNSTVTMKACTVSNNATNGSVAGDILYAKDSTVTVTDTDFIGNNTLVVPDTVSEVTPNLFCLDNSPLTMTGGKITKNGAKHLFCLVNSAATIKGTTITDNAAGVMSLNNLNQTAKMNDCSLGNNKAWSSHYAIDLKKQDEVVMTNCVLRDTTLSHPDYVKITHEAVSKEESVLGIRGILADGTIAFDESYKSFAYGWNLAISHALSGSYDRVEVDLYSSWYAEQGKFTDSFTNGKGFYENAIYIPENAKITLHLNGHTISRGLGYAVDNGSVMIVDKNADVIINNGTITGGYSNTGAGGIHINGAKVTLNNVRIYRNKAGNSDGSGIAALDGAALTMNGGRFAENDLVNCGTLYVKASTATLNNVTMTKNWAAFPSTKGTAVYAVDSTVVMNGCDVPNCTLSAQSIVEGHNSTFTLENTSFTGNSSSNKYGYTYLFFLTNSHLSMKDGKITSNRPAEIFHLENTEAALQGVTVTDNASCVLSIGNNGQKVTLTECTLGNNVPAYGEATAIRVQTQDTLELIDCTLGDTAFANKDVVAISSYAVGSMFGEGSLTMILVLLAVVVCGVTAFHLARRSMKKKAAATETEGEE